ARESTPAGAATRFAWRLGGRALRRWCHDASASVRILGTWSRHGSGTAGGRRDARIRRDRFTARPRNHLPFLRAQLPILLALADGGAAFDRLSQVLRRYCCPGFYGLFSS